MSESLDSMLKKFENRGKSVSHKLEKNTAEIIQLSLWRDFERAAPSCVLRSALFGVVKRGRRRYLEDETLAAWGNDEIKYRGQRLDQADLDVWMEMLHLCRETGLGATIEFEKYAFLNRIRPSQSKKSKKDWLWLESSMKRMIACCVEIKSGDKRYFGSLIESGAIDEESGRYVLSLNSKMVTLFKAGMTLQHAEKRHLLNTDLAKWLAGDIEGHGATEKKPYYGKVESFYKRCGAEVSRLGDFRKALRKAADELKKQKIIKSWKITKDDIFQVVKWSG